MQSTKAKKLKYLLNHLVGTVKRIDECINEIDKRVGQCDPKDENFEQIQKEIWREVVKQGIEKDNENDVTYSLIETYLDSHPNSYPENVREMILSEPDKLLDNLVDQLCLIVEK